jgi:hypothetical protein
MQNPWIRQRLSKWGCQKKPEPRSSLSVSRCDSWASSVSKAYIGKYRPTTEASNECPFTKGSSYHSITGQIVPWQQIITDGIKPLPQVLFKSCRHCRDLFRFTFTVTSLNCKHNQSTLVNLSPWPLVQAKQRNDKSHAPLRSAASRRWRGPGSWCSSNSVKLGFLLRKLHAAWLSTAGISPYGESHVPGSSLPLWCWDYGSMMLRSRLESYRHCRRDFFPNPGERGRERECGHQYKTLPQGSSEAVRHRAPQALPTTQ